jgi:hypothetical protein
MTASLAASIWMLLASAAPLVAQEPSDLVRAGDRVVRFTVALPDSALRVTEFRPPAEHATDPATGATEGAQVTLVALEGVGGVTRPSLAGDVTVDGQERLDGPRVPRQFAQREWGTYYVLLGGAVSIVPTRIVTTAGAGNGEWWTFESVGTWSPSSSGPLFPPINPGECVYVSSDMVVLRQDPSLPVHDSTLLIANGLGLALSRVSSPTPNAPGWTYVAPNWSVSAVPTEYIVVHAPAAALGLTHLMALTQEASVQ